MDSFARALQRVGIRRIARQHQQPETDNPNLPVNIDYVWGFSDTEAQHWMPPGLWVAGLMILMPLLLFVPTHYLLRRVMPKPVSAW